MFDLDKIDPKYRRVIAFAYLAWALVVSITIYVVLICDIRNDDFEPTTGWAGLIALSLIAPLLPFAKKFSFGNASIDVTGKVVDEIKVTMAQSRFNPQVPPSADDAADLAFDLFDISTSPRGGD